MLKLLFRVFLFVFFIILLGVLAITRPFVLWRNPQFSSIVVSEENLKLHVTQLSEKFRPRDSAHPENLKYTAEYIRSQLSRDNSRVKLQNFTADDHEFSNVISDYGPEIGERIIVGAHYDAFSDLPGADDNASGVAGLLELGRLLAIFPPAVPVSIVAFPLEEPPFFRTAQMGSAVHAMSLKKAGVSVRLMICLEMIGYFSDQENSQQYPSSIMKLWYPTRGNFIAIIDTFSFNLNTLNIKRSFLNHTLLDAVSINAPSIIPGIDFSDHYSYWQQGFPALMISDTAFYRNQAYHTSEDLASRLDYAKMAEVVRGVYSYLKLQKP